MAKQSSIELDGVITEALSNAMFRVEVPNYGRRGNGVLLTEGMVIAIEPMINMGTARVRQLKDGWTVVSADGKPSAHFEHTVAVKKGKAEVLSSFEMIEKTLGQKVLI